MSNSAPIRPSRLPTIIGSTAVAVAIAIFLLPPFAGLTPHAMQALGLLVLTIGLWGTAVVPQHLTTLLLFTIALIGHVAPPNLVFSGFYSGGPWLIFSGIVIGLAMQRTGLGARMAETMVARLGGSFTGIVVGTLILSVLLAFVMPSAMGRTVIMTPILMAFADQVGFTEGRKGRAAIVFGGAMATMVTPMAILPATVPITVFAGSIESVHGIVPRYAEFMALHMPVKGLLSLAVLIGLVLVLLRDRQDRIPEPAAAKAWSLPEIRLACILGLLLLIWSTDAIHHIPPAWVGLLAAVLCLLPLVGVVPAGAMAQNVNYTPWFFVAGIIGLGAIVAHTGLAQALGSGLIAELGFVKGADFRNFVMTAILGGTLTPLLNYSGVPAVLTPLGPDIAAATGWPLKTALMTQVLGFYTFFLPYQAPPLATAMIMAGIPLRHAIPVCLSFSIIFLVAIMPLDFLWWKALGMFG